MAVDTRVFATFTDDSTIGTVAVTNPGNAAASDSSNATWSLNANNTGHYLNAQGSSHSSGTALSSGDTITQIVYKVKRSVTGGAGTAKDFHLYPVESGSIVTTTDFADTSTAWPGSSGTVSYTQTTNLPSASTVLASNWGFVIAPKETSGFSSVTAAVDFMSADITFTPAAAVIYVPPLIHSQAVSRAANY